MGIYSPYAVAESEQPQWMPGENLAAAAFVGIALFLVLDVNVGMWRVFRKRIGYYYWSMQLGTLACAVDALGVILKYFVPHSGHIWVLYTVLLLGGWSVYAPAQLLVLYSRLHLVNESHRLQRGVLIMIASTIFLIIVPTWIFVWPAYDTDPRISSLWSPRDAIVERYNQIGKSVLGNLFDDQQIICSRLYCGRIGPERDLCVVLAGIAEPKIQCTTTPRHAGSDLCECHHRSF